MISTLETGVLSSRMGMSQSQSLPPFHASDVEFCAFYTTVREKEFTRLERSRKNM
jgi:hypothetical protein